MVLVFFHEKEIPNEIKSNPSETEVNLYKVNSETTEQTNVTQEIDFSSRAWPVMIDVSDEYQNLSVDWYEKAIKLSDDQAVDLIRQIFPEYKPELVISELTIGFPVYKVAELSGYELSDNSLYILLQPYTYGIETTHWGYYFFKSNNEFVLVNTDEIVPKLQYNPTFYAATTTAQLFHNYAYIDTLNISYPTKITGNSDGNFFHVSPFGKRAMFGPSGAQDNLGGIGAESWHRIFDSSTSSPAVKDMNNTDNDLYFDGRFYALRLPGGSVHEYDYVPKFLLYGNEDPFSDSFSVNISWLPEYNNTSKYRIPIPTGFGGSAIISSVRSGQYKDFFDFDFIQDKLSLVGHTMDGTAVYGSFEPNKDPIHKYLEDSHCQYGGEKNIEYSEAKIPVLYWKDSYDTWRILIEEHQKFCLSEW